MSPKRLHKRKSPAVHAADNAAAHRRHTVESATSNSTANALTISSEREQANIKLCQLVQQHPCLYDRSNANYGKKQVCEQVWEQIAKACDENVSICKERWRNIRAAFARSINFYKTPGGANRVKPYYLHDELSFLISYMKDAHESHKTKSDNLKQSKTAEELEDAASDTTTERDAVDDELPNAAAETTNLEYTQQAELEQLNLLACDAIEPAPSSELLADELDNEPQQQQQKKQAATDLAPKLNNPAHAPCKRGSEPSRNCDGSTAKKLRVDQISSSDADAQFLTMLLPDMRAMNQRQKIIFKAKIYNCIAEVLDMGANFPAHSAAAQAMPPTAQSVLNSIASLSDSELQRLRSAACMQCEQSQVITDTQSGGEQSQMQDVMLPLPIIVKEEMENFENLEHE